MKPRAEYDRTRAFETELDRLRDVYLEHLPQKLQQIEQSWQVLSEDRENGEQLSTFYRFVHNLAGGAGVYGVNTVAEKARALLDLIRSSVEGNEPLSSEVVMQIDTGVLTLKQSVLNVRRDADPGFPGGVGTATLEKQPAEAPGDTGVSEIFLVEDDPDQARFLSLLLEQAGHRVHAFTRLDELKFAIQAVKPTAILMDMMFPEGKLAGAQTIAELQAVAHETLPVIFISARSDMEARLHAVRAGATAYFTKPVDASNLINALKRLADNLPHEQARILILDDDPTVGEFYVNRLERDPTMRARTLADPMRLLEAMESYRPDMILMDLHMPGCDGFELAALIRQHEIYGDTPVVFLTQDSDEEKRTAALNLGSDDYFSKSMNPDLLARVVRSRLKRLRGYARVKRAAIWAPTN